MCFSNPSLTAMSVFQKAACICPCRCCKSHLSPQYQHQPQTWLLYSCLNYSMNISHRVNTIFSLSCTIYKFYHWTTSGIYTLIFIFETSILFILFILFIYFSLRVWIYFYFFLILIFYCYSVTVVCLFSPPYPSQTPLPPPRDKYFRSDLNNISYGKLQWPWKYQKPPQRLLLILVFKLYILQYS